MAPRTYRADYVPKRSSLHVVKPKAPTGPIKEWKDGRLLHDLKEAAEILTQQLGLGFSYDELRNKIRSGDLTEGVHWFKKGRYYKINIQRVIDWQIET